MFAYAGIMKTNMQLQCLHKEVADVFPLYSSTFPEMCVCDAMAYDCMAGNCMACGELELFDTNFVKNIPGEHLLKQIQWNRWEDSGGKNGESRTAGHCRRPGGRAHE